MLGWISHWSARSWWTALARPDPVRTRSTRRSPASRWRGCCSTIRCSSHWTTRARWKAGSWGCRASGADKKRGRARRTRPRREIRWKAPGGADRLELLASALGHVGLEALLAHPLEEGRVGFGLDDAIELAPVGRDEAHTVDLQIVHTPPAVPEMETVVERDLAAAVGEDLRPHRRVVRSAGLAEVWAVRA